jgi:hypothetical protein
VSQGQGHARVRHSQGDIGQDLRGGGSVIECISQQVTEITGVLQDHVRRRESQASQVIAKSGSNEPPSAVLMLARPSQHRQRTLGLVARQPLQAGLGQAGIGS